MQPLGENMADRVEQPQGADKDTSEPIDTTSVESIPGSSRAPCSSQSTPSSALDPIASVYKLDAQMATLLHHI